MEYDVADHLKRTCVSQGSRSMFLPGLRCSCNRNNNNNINNCITYNFNFNKNNINYDNNYKCLFIRSLLKFREIKCRTSA